MKAVMISANEENLLQEAAIEQTHCFTCGNKLDHVRYECPICYEWQCSEECRKKHIETLDNV